MCLNKFKLFIVNYYAKVTCLFIKLPTKTKLSETFCFTQTVKNPSTFAINLSSDIVCYNLSEGESEKEGIYFEKRSRVGDRHYKNTEALSLHSSEDT